MFTGKPQPAVITIPPPEAERPLPELITPKPLESYKPEDQTFLEKPFLLPKPIPHSPKISPSSIPNPNPSVTAGGPEKPIASSYPNYGGYLYSIPGYSAFQPISYPGVMQPTQGPLQSDKNSDFIPYASIPKDNTIEDKIKEPKTNENQTPKVDLNKTQMDFEEQFTPEIIEAVNVPEAKKIVTESKMSITSLTQGSGATVTIPSLQANTDVNKKKVPERFSLKTSIPISKIDMKCVSNPPDPVLQKPLPKKVPTFNPAFQNTKPDGPKVEIQSNIVIKSAKEPEPKIDAKQITPVSNSINTLINAAEAINKTDTQFRKPEPKVDTINEVKDPPPFTPPAPNTNRPMFNPLNLETSKTNPNKPPDANFNEQKNQIVFIQNKNPTNPKMLVTIQQQNPQVLLQRTNFDSKNLQAPSRLSTQSKKSKEDLVENGSSSKVVALKRLHQENCDENDFENLITENQIYGNKIVVKEKSQGTQQEQDLKNKSKPTDKNVTSDTKNVVLQPNFVYLSNVQFPGNLMMIKNNAKVGQTPDTTKVAKVVPNENKATNEVSTMTNTSEASATIKNTKPNVAVSKEIHVLKSSNNVLQTLSNKTNKTEVVFQSPHQKVIMNPHVVYQVVDTDNKGNQQFINRDYTKLIGQKKEYPKQFEQKQNDKLFIACPYQMDSKLQPKIVITNIRSKISKIDEVSSLDIYEKRRRLRRLKYLSNRETKDSLKVDPKKGPEKIDVSKNIITPDKMRAEIYKEYTNTKVTVREASSESDSDFGEEDLKDYASIIKEFGPSTNNDKGKAEFLANFRLATHDDYKGKFC